jgi:regulator of nucleoside diphosphate kinase
MEKTMYVTTNDYQKLVQLAEQDAWRYKHAGIADRLLKELQVAKRLPQEKISENVITMNSRVLFKELSSGRENEITLTYPEEADSSVRKISVFSPIGVALLGCREGDIASWRVPSGVGRFKVLRVTYQPEAAGHYYL